jgi:phenylalanyl-tRNA synthetase alpha chain
MTALEQQLQSTRAEAEAAIAACGDTQALLQLKAKYVGPQGAVTVALKQLGALPKEDKPRVGKLANEV